MNPTHTHPRHCISYPLAALVAAFAFVPLRAQEVSAAKPQTSETKNVIRLEDFEVSEPRISAQTMAPVESRLDATEPMSSINLQTIQNSVPPTADYALIANLAPSVTLTGAANGPGLTESKASMRGFGDGSYNVTIDGIPFGDGNDYTHHTTSYFPAKLLGRVTVDRGPGDASTIGMATFGGTMALETKDPRTTESFVPTLSYGSYNTKLAHLEYNTGILPKTNGGSLIASYQYMDSDGYRTFGTLRRNTYFFKYLQPIGKAGKTTLSFMGEYNNIKFNNPNASPLTGQQILTLGRNFGQTNDPTNRTGDYYGSNYQVKHTDTSFIAIDSDLGNGWKADEKVYSFSYDNSSHESPDVLGGGVKNPTTGKITAGTDLSGQFKVNVVRSYGTYAAISHDDDIGTFKTGIWFDYQHGPRYKYAVDYNLANAQALGMGVNKGGYIDPLYPKTTGGWFYNMHFYTRTWEPYAEYAWHPVSNLTITPGIKYMRVQRVIEAPINQTTNMLPAFYSQVYAKALPLATLNYRLSSNWSTYAQFADGMLTPPLAYFQEDNPQKNIVTPQRTTNYQIGTVYKTNRFNADFDGYFIRSHNIPVTQLNPATNYTDPVTNKVFSSPNDTITSMAAGAYYYGVEAEATYYVGGGFSSFVNGSRNYATYEKSKRRIDNVPQATGGFGFLYDHSGFFSSLMAKYTGPYNTYVGAPNPDTPLPATSSTFTQGGYTLCDLTLGYGMKLERGSFLKSFKARLQVTNLFDREMQTLAKPKALSLGVLNPLTSTYNVYTPRGYFLTVSSEF